MPVERSHNGHAEFKELLTPYCFGDITDAERTAFELHLLDCDDCWEEVQRLERAIGALRTDRTLLKRLITPSTLGFLGLSGRIDRPFGGHLWHALLSCLLYSFLYGISLVFEVAHESDRLGTSAWWLAMLAVLPWIVGTSLLLSAMSVFFVAVVVLLAATFFFLPNRPIVSSTLHAYPANMAYVKDASYYFPYALVFLLLPFHFVISIQKQLREGQYRLMFALLTGDRAGIPPRGAVFPKVWLLGAILAGIGLLSVYLTTNLFDHLAQSRYTALFMFLILLRTFAFFALGVECLMWYSRSLDELKRECLTILKDFPHIS